jgi:hypothetical protein
METAGPRACLRHAPPVKLRSRLAILHGIRKSPATCAPPPTAMPLGISPINDFAFKKTFGTPENRIALISLLNAILEPKSPIVEVTLENPFNPQRFQTRVTMPDR